MTERNKRIYLIMKRKFICIIFVFFMLMNIFPKELFLNFKVTEDTAGFSNIEKIANNKYRCTGIALQGNL